jgi:hypothetical protein|tara:strand:+ start:1512 stop:1661 length:150 start_codon:yes stop_codon:yes gene_type:complete
MEKIMSKEDQVKQLWQEYQAIMANAYMGDENAVLDKIEALGGMNDEDLI